MTHPRKTIRANVVALLTGLTLTGPRVFASRVAPLDEPDLPAIRVYFDGEQSQAISIHGQDPRERDITFRIELVAQANTALDDTLDDIAEEVEAALIAAPDGTWLGGTLGDSIGTETELDEDARQPVGIARLSITINTYA